MALDNFYDRTDPSKNYEKHLFRAGYGLQSAELNELQETSIARLKSVGDALFKDGDIVKDCACLVDQDTGATTLNGGALYIRGTVRGVAPASFTIPVDEIIAVGIRLISTEITELEDPTLRDPAVGTRNYQEPGAGRLETEAVWGWDGDGGAGDFFAVYTVEFGVLLNKAPPPQLDSVTNAIARYDRDSAGGRYVVSGFGVSAQFDSATSKLITLITEGRARVNGFGVDVPRGLRIVEDMDRDTKSVIAEPKTFTPDGSGNMRINLDYSPVVTLDQVRITAEKTVTVTHGAFSGAKDPLPDNSILSLVEVKQGATTYVQGTDYKLTSGQVDWSLVGAEPAPGSTYTVKYQYQTTNGTVTGLDSTGFTISGAVSGTLVTIDYTFALPRIDAIVLDAEGRATRIKGVASQFSPAAPAIPATELQIATLYHTWADDPVVTQDAVVVMPMNELQGIRGMVIDLFDLVAQERLRNDIGLAETAAKRGVFVDPMTNDNLRDAGVAQTAAIVNGELMLPVDAAITQIGAALTAPAMLTYSLESVVEQTNRTGTMKVNPYMSFAPVPATLTLKPGVDFWTQTIVNWTSPITQRFVTWESAGLLVRTSSAVASQLVSSATSAATYLRPISVEFSISGFDPGETLATMTFDGITVTPEAL